MVQSVSQPVRRTLAQTVRQTVRVRNARISILTGLQTNEKWILHSIKGGFAFSWAFVNAICYFLSGRFFTMMTGNTLILAVETLQWKTEEMLFTATLIALFVIGSALFDGLSFWLKNEDKVVKYFVVPFGLLLGVVSDVLWFVQRGRGSGCLSELSGTTSGDGCTDGHPYYLTPMGEKLFLLFPLCSISYDCVLITKTIPLYLYHITQ